MESDHKKQEKRCKGSFCEIKEPFKRSMSYATNSMNWYKTAALEDIPDFAQKMFGLGKYEPKPSYHDCPKCGNPKATHKEMHPDTDMNEIVECCPDCGEIS